jgi:hypothetical protein
VPVESLGPDFHRYRMHTSFSSGLVKKEKARKDGFFCTHGLAAFSKIPQYPLRQAIELESIFGTTK